MANEEKKTEAKKTSKLDNLDAKFGEKDKDGNRVKTFKCNKVKGTFKVTTKMGK